MYKKCKHTLERPRFHDERNMLLSKMGFVFWSSVLFCGWSIWNGSISCVPKTRVEFTSFEFTAFIHKYKIKEWFYSPSWSISGKHIPWCFTFGMVFFIVARCQNLDNILACATNNAWDWTCRKSKDIERSWWTTFQRTNYISKELSQPSLAPSSLPQKFSATQVGSQQHNFEGATFSRADIFCATRPHTQHPCYQQIKFIMIQHRSCSHFVLN